MPAVNNRTYVVVGWPMLDVVVKAPSLPNLSDAINAKFHHSPGGSAVNVALNLHRMGLSAHLVGVAGADDSGDSVRKSLEREGLRTSLAMRGYTPEVLCLVTEDGEPMRFSNLMDIVSLGLADIDDAWADESCALHFEGWQLNDATTRSSWARLASRAHRAGATVSLDVPHPSYIEQMGVPALQAAIQQIGVDVLFANHHEAEAANLWADPASWASIVVVHSGGEPTLVISNGAVQQFPVEAVPVPIDATGAGDAFASGFIASYAQSRSLDDAVKAAHAAGREAVLTHGAALSLSSASSFWALVSGTTGGLGMDAGGMSAQRDFGQGR